MAELARSQCGKSHGKLGFLVSITEKPKARRPTLWPIKKYWCKGYATKTKPHPHPAHLLRCFSSAFGGHLFAHTLTRLFMCSGFLALNLSSFFSPFSPFSLVSFNGPEICTFRNQIQTPPGQQLFFYFFVFIFFVLSVNGRLMDNSKLITNEWRLMCYRIIN